MRGCVCWALPPRKSASLPAAGERVPPSPPPATRCRRRHGVQAAGWRHAGDAGTLQVRAPTRGTPLCTCSHPYVPELPSPAAAAARCYRSLVSAVSCPLMHTPSQQPLTPAACFAPVPASRPGASLHGTNRCRLSTHRCLPPTSAATSWPTHPSPQPPPSLPVPTPCPSRPCLRACVCVRVQLPVHGSWRHAAGQAGHCARHPTLPPRRPPCLLPPAAHRRLPVNCLKTRFLPLHTAAVP